MKTKPFIKIDPSMGVIVCAVCVILIGGCMWIGVLWGAFKCFE